MTKSILFALLAVAGSMIFTDDAFARCCRRSRCCAAASCCAAPSCCAAQSSCGTGSCSTGCSACSASASMPAAPAAPVVASNATGSSSYQSYSYEPGATAPVATTTNTVAAPVYYYQARQTQNSEYNRVLRGDHKLRAFTE